ncbi:hypothetical protein [Melissospora conviva]|uniref:hypothetical protein n=1 Tax=Melissospora conviva TaxID=3388432 RepID=UPI003C1B058E
MSVQQAGRGADARECALYQFWVRHPVTGEKVLGYKGETARMPFTRLMEHVYEQPWADTIIGWEVDERVYRGKAEVLAAEKAAIEAERPLYNYKHNLGNPHRIEVWRAREQRRERDRLRARDSGWRAGRGARVPRQRAAAAVAESSGRVGYAVGWVARRVWDHPRQAALAVGWPVVAVWAAVQVAEVPALHAGHGLWVGCSLASLLAGVLLPGPRRRRRRR